MTEQRARRSSARSARRLLAALVLVVVSAAVCSEERQAAEDVIEHETVGSFFTVPSPLPAGAPGTLIKQRRLLGAPNGAIAWRVLYRSTDVTGAPIAVSGIVVAPTGPGPSGGRPVVSWAHPTTGSARRCAPSVGLDPFLLIEGLHELLDEGYVVAATDYPGMGASGPSSYLVGVTEGNSVLDAARAAREIGDAHAGPHLLLWGHSQGGQAALFAAQDAPAYAPELDLLAVAVAAPAVELGELLADDIGDVSGVTIGSYAFDAYQQVYSASHPDLSLGSILTPAGAAAVPKMASLCLFGQNKQLHAIANPLVGHFLAADPSTTEPWATLLAANTPGGAPVGVPMYVAQGEADTLVKPSTTAQYVTRLCGAHEHVDFRRYPGITHALIAYRTLPELLPWFADVVAHRTTEDTCPARVPS